MIARRTLLTAAGLTSVAAALAGCGESAETVPGSSISPGTAAGGSDAGEASDGGVFAPLTVSGPVGEEPVVELAGPLTFESPHSTVIIHGSGQKITEGSTIIQKSGFYNPEDGSLLHSQWERKQSTVFQISSESVGDESVAFFTALSTGSRYAMVGFDQAGTPVLQVGDVEGIALGRADGAAQQLGPEFPAFTLQDDGSPQLSGKPKGEPPTALLHDASIVGSGPKAAADDTLVMHYRGWDFETGEEFDSSWSRGVPFDFVLGAGDVIAGWDTSLDGAAQGSQIVMVIPPAEAYQDQGELAGKTLVFVADVLYVAKP